MKMSHLRPGWRGGGRVRRLLEDPMEYCTVLLQYLHSIDVLRSPVGGCLAC